jgi:hypothetical protein
MSSKKREVVALLSRKTWLDCGTWGRRSAQPALCLAYKKMHRSGDAFVKFIFREELSTIAKSPGCCGALELAEPAGLHRFELFCAPAPASFFLA